MLMQTESIPQPTPTNAFYARLRHKRLKLSRDYKDAESYFCILYYYYLVYIWTPLQCGLFLLHPGCIKCMKQMHLHLMHHFNEMASIQSRNDLDFGFNGPAVFAFLINRSLVSRERGTGANGSLICHLFRNNCIKSVPLSKTVFSTRVILERATE